MATVVKGTVGRARFFQRSTATCGTSVNAPRTRRPPPCFPLRLCPLSRRRYSAFSRHIGTHSRLLFPLVRSRHGGRAGRCSVRHCSFRDGLRSVKAFLVSAWRARAGARSSARSVARCAAGRPGTQKRAYAVLPSFCSRSGTPGTVPAVRRPRPSASRRSVRTCPACVCRLASRVLSAFRTTSMRFPSRSSPLLPRRADPGYPGHVCYNGKRPSHGPEQGRDEPRPAARRWRRTSTPPARRAPFARRGVRWRDEERGDAQMPPCAFGTTDPPCTRTQRHARSRVCRRTAERRRLRRHNDSSTRRRVAAKEQSETANTCRGPPPPAGAPTHRRNVHSCGGARAGGGEDWSRHDLRAHVGQGDTRTPRCDVRKRTRSGTRLFTRFDCAPRAAPSG
ncbi:hypothetical protein ERJ75_001315600 [Trypanosoma vivax]|nr:hypothetical protein ERJ75_001315600 [Trypanosoma vivax]